jgi:hypothetical protein
MKSMKANMPVLLLGLVTFITGTLAAQNSQASFTGNLGWYNPCISGHAVIASTTTYIDYHQNGSHEVVHVVLRGTGQDYDLSSWVGTGQIYDVNFEANGQFDFTEMPESYPVPFHSVWVGQGSVANFSMDGTILVYMHLDNAGNPVPWGSSVTTTGLTTACIN